MEKFWQKIIDNKKNLIYFPILILFWVFSLFYRFGRYLNLKFAGQPDKLKLPVISVGNLTVGGSGKTPVVIEIARHLIKSEKRVGIVSSGYGRSVRLDYSAYGRDITGSNNDTNDLDNVGDEIMMMAELLPDAYFSVSQSKTNGARIIESKKTADIIIVDDGYQHRRLRRDFNILLIDTTHNIFEESLLPLGRLREPISVINQADYIIFTKTNLKSNCDDIKRQVEMQFPQIPISSLQYNNHQIISKKKKIGIEEVKNSSIYFFAGIGNFDSAIRMLSEKFTNICSFRQFNDHCRYNKSEPSQIRADIGKFKPDYVITTHKDYVKVINLDLGREIY
ncbi:MAG: tetraacyldisaccharide 4'-kinase, partial [Candidatus Zixiibacteriota bacterium]